MEGVTVTALDRSGTVAVSGSAAGMRCVRGDLLDVASYERELAGCDAVLHLAAATGKASPERHLRETAQGTEVLLEACRRAGVSRFLFVSSIAAAFPDKRDYPYAQAKERAERAVAASGLRYTIIRPTMVLGEGAPILASLSTLASLPVVLLPGSGIVTVQPIAVDDVVRAILTVVRTDRFEGETFAIGGPERLTMEELLQRVRLARKGRRGRVLRVPVGLIQAPLRAAERLGLRGIIPATAGQFTSFRQDGTAGANPLQQDILTNGVSITDMLAIAPRGEADAANIVDHECRVFTRHLLGMAPDALVLASYQRAVATVPALAPAGNWDRALLAVARRGVLVARCADAHAALFARSSALRKRLVMLLAILETRPPFADEIDRAVGGNMPVAIARVALRGLGSILGLVVGTVLLLPLRLASAARRSPAP
jgi:NADH dehydrogenase